MNAPAYDPSGAGGARDPGRAADAPVALVDDEGVWWQVTERDCAHVPGARAPRCLVFMSDEAVRRIWFYPPGWRRLSPDALLALSERRDQRPPV